MKDLTRRFIHRLKVMELKIDSPDFDFSGAGSAIDQYSLRNNIPSRIKYRIRLAFEELAQQMLFPVLKHTPVLKRAVEELSYTYYEEAELSNTIRVVIRE